MKTLGVLLLSIFPSILVAEVPEPKAVFGFRPGDDYKLARHEQIVAYFRALDDASERVVVEEIGRSTLGRPLILAFISSEENLRARARYREISRSLALAKDLSEADARSLAKEGKAIVWIDGGLHATEVAHAQHTPELAWWLATSESDEARLMRSETILLLMPVMNPDGLNIVVDWYERNLGTPFETAPVPELYHPYVGHDNNRDWYMFTQVETQAVARQLYHEWFPQIVYNHHQSGPFPGRIWIPPFENPVNPNLDPLIVATINQIGESMRKRFSEEGKKGVSSGIVYDMWWNGSMRGAPDFHNMAGFLTETALYRYATPHCYDESEIPETFGPRAGNLPAKIPSTNYTDPWLGGCWHLRDPIEYMLTASRAVLDIGAELREDFLFNIYRMGRRQIERGERAEGGPFAYVIDVEAQHDPGAAVELLRTFRQAGVEIRRDTNGAYVIPPQAFRPFVVDLMEPKVYPDRRQYPGGPPDPPYDTTGYELSFQMGVHPERVTDRFEIPKMEVSTVPPPNGKVEGDDAKFGYALSKRYNLSALAVNRLLKQGARVSWSDDSWIVESAPRGAVETLAEELGLRFEALAADPGDQRQAIHAPRIGLYRSHVANMPEGWTRWLFDRYELDYENLYDADIGRGELDRFDVIVLPDQEADRIRNGHLPGTMPEEYVGGIGAEGGAALSRYVASGGWLFAIDQAADFAIDLLGLPIRNDVRDLRPQEFFIPGSIIRVEVDQGNPLASGMPSEAYAFFVRSQAFSIVPPASEGNRRAERQVDVYARYPEKHYLVSGWAHGADRHLAGKIAAARVPHGKGQVVLLGFSPHFRGQPHNTYKLLFNVLYAATRE